MGRLKTGECASVIRNIPTQELILTNPQLNEPYVRALADRLQNDQTMAHSHGCVRVRNIPEKGFFVVDGNHFVAACVLAGIPTVLAEIFELSNE